ncbi:hypothetical protein GCM10020000_76370 [Streptomyces olivoverticillatus]
MHQHALAGAGLPAAVQGEVDGVAVGDADALGHAGGAGGEHHVGEPVGCDGQGRVGVRPLAICRRVGVRVADEQRTGAGLGQQLARGVVGEQQLCSGVGHDAPHALGRVAVVQRHVDAAGLEDGEGGHDQGGRALQQHRDRAFGLKALGDQAVGQAVGVGVEFAVGQLPSAVADGDGVGGAGGLFGEAPGERGGGAVRLVGGGVPLGQDALALGVVEDRQGPDAAVRIGGGRRQQAGEPVGQGLRGAAVEHVRAVLQHRVDAVGRALRGVPLVQVEREVELGGAEGDRFGPGGQARQVQAAAGGCSAGPAAPGRAGCARASARG